MIEANNSGRWCILRTSSPRTLSLVALLRAAGIDAWTPTLTMTRRLSRRRKMKTEYNVPVLASYAFAPAADIPALVALEVDAASPHPAFSIFRHNGAIYRLSDHKIAALREFEREHLDARTREHERVRRANELNTKRAREKALRASGKALAVGTDVRVNGASFLTGMIGKVVESADKETTVLFGGSLPITIETWLLAPDAVGAPLP